MRYRRSFADSTEVRSPTRTSTEVRSPTRTATSTEAYTSGNVTVTGGAGAGNTTVYIPSARSSSVDGFLVRYKTPILIGLGTVALIAVVAVARNSRKRKRRK